MSWVEHHERSENLAAQAEVAARAGLAPRSRDLYAEAAKAEEQALKDTDRAKARTLGITSVSAVSLYYKAAQLESAERVACQCLGSEKLPEFAVEQIRGLLHSIWSERARQRANVNFAPGQVLVSLKGGEIIEGGAPLDLIVEKVQTVQALFYRTVEWLRGLPHRMHGGPTRDIVETCRPWLFQAAPGSYQFAVAVQAPRQMSFFDSDASRPQAVADHFMKILRATVEDPEGLLPDVVPDTEYRTTFLNLTRNLAPTGKRFSRLDVRSTAETRPVSLGPETRMSVRKVIHAARPAELPSEGEQQTVRGILRAVHLDKDWIEVAVDDSHVRVVGVGETVDDVIGPMVNHAVVIQVTSSRSGSLRYRDIELDE